MPFTNKNRCYETDESKGHSHGKHTQKGSVFKEPIYEAEDGSCSLWFEHVKEINDTEDGRNDLYWLMWYDAKGNSTTKVSGILSREGVRTFSKNLASFLEMP